MNLINKDELIAKDIKFQIFVNKKNILTSERQLSQNYKVSRNTIRDALKILMNEHIIEKRNKKYIVKNKMEDFDTKDILNIQNKNHLTNKIINITDLEANKKTAREIRQPLGTKIKNIKYVRHNEDENIVSVDNIIIPQNSLSGQEWKLSNNSVIQLINDKLLNHINREYQKLNVISSKTNDLTSILACEYVLERTSLFLSIDPTDFIYIVSYKNPEFCVLTQPDKEIYEKVGGFDE
jgi:DNA-binding GntR family transcriptional regulator